MDIKFTKYILKPVFSAGIMGAIAFGTHHALLGVLGNSKATIIAIVVGAITYGVMIVLTKTLDKDDWYMIPYGTKIYKLLEKLKIYKEEKV